METPAGQPGHPGETVHISRRYDQDLERLRERILAMGGNLVGMIKETMRALVERDSAAAKRMIDYDHEINRQEVAIDELSLNIIALRQPAASDLRFITLALKVSTDLERIGDLCVNIAERTLELNEEPQLKPYLDLPKMAEAAEGMIVDALEAFLHGDADACGGGDAARRQRRPAQRAGLPRTAEFHDRGPQDDLAGHAPALHRQVPRAHGGPRHEHRGDGDLHGQGQGHPPHGHRRLTVAAAEKGPICGNCPVAHSRAQAREPRRGLEFKALGHFKGRRHFPKPRAVAAVPGRPEAPDNLYPFIHSTSTRAK